MPRAPLILLFAGVGYVVAALAGYLLVMALSSNTHDRSLEAVMTAAFLCGPVGAVMAGVVAFFRTAWSSRPQAGEGDRNNRDADDIPDRP